jgi:hypothetical protein
VKKGNQKIVMRIVAKDMYQLISKFESAPHIAELDEFMILTRVFHEQCEFKPSATDTEPKISMTPPKDVSPHSVQHPSDLEAGYSANKGCGYQAQLVETCQAQGNSDLRLITIVEVESAAEHDANAVKPIIKELEARGIKAKQALADTAYGGDSNVTFAADKGITLISPVPGKDPGKNESQQDDENGQIALTLSEM